ncbi:MAG: serine/threonine-protein kinase [Kofleriaceae bacterium]
MDDAGDPHRTAGRWPRVVPATAGGAPGAGVGQGGTLELPPDDVVAPRPPSTAPAPGARIGRFVVGERLGAGGMGVVYAARDPELDRAVAIKLVRADRNWDSVRARLLREARAMAQLDHPNVVRVHELGDHDGAVYVAMELVDGVALDAWLATPRPWRDIVRVFLQAADGLAAVHRAGMVHRDIKPSNILVDRTGRARLADFGLVRDEASDLRLTVTGARVGTPGYMAPEQERDGAVDARADQYSLAVALERALARATTPPPPALRRAVARGRAADPGDRFGSIEDLATAIDRAIHPRRGRVATALAGTAAVAVGIAAAVALTTDWLRPARSQPATVAAAPDQPLAAPAVDGGSPDAAPATDGGSPDAAAPLDDGRSTVASPARPAAPAAPRLTTAPPAPAPPPRTPTAPADATDRETSEVEGVALPRPSPAPAPAPPVLATRITDRAHLAAARVAIRDLGYIGLPVDDLDADPAGTTRALRARRDALVAARDPGDPELPIATTRLGLAARRRGDCAEAAALLRQAATEFAAYDVAKHQLLAPALWRSRAGFGLGLCQLGRGDLTGARAAIRQADLSWIRPAQEAEVAQHQFALAIVYFEQGGAAYGHTRWMVDTAAGAARGSGQAALVDTMLAWARAVGVPSR